MNVDLHSLAGVLDVQVDFSSVILSLSSELSSDAVTVVFDTVAFVAP